MGTDQSIVRRVEGNLAAALAPRVSPIVARISINIRVGTMEDVPFIDSLQKAQTRAVGFLPTKAIEGKIARNEALVAWARPCGTGETPVLRDEPVGYLIASDRYQKRDEIGYITQINVVPRFRRSLVAAALLQARFDRSAYGCRLYCCWCAQDLTSANEFWEAMGFTPIAFRTGSRTKGKKGRGSRAAGGARIHIFWQKRIREDDVTTPWWYPSATGGGEMREDRLVFPIPPGVSWRDVLPVVLAGEEPEARSQKPAAEVKRPRAKKVLKPRLKGSLWFKHQGIVEKVAPPREETKLANRAIDPRLKKLARELRDRWTERANLILPAPAKHDVRRMIAQEMEPHQFAAIALPMSPGSKRPLPKRSLPKRPLPKRNAA